MFKNPIKVSAHNDISVKDRKNLKRDLGKSFSTEVVDQIFIRSQTLAVTKLQGSKIQIFSDEDDPLFVDSTSNSDFFPTIYCVNNYPDISKSVYINPGVAEFLKKGANLMWAGVADLAELDPESINPDDVVAIRDKETNQVVAVGALASAIADSQNALSQGKKAEGIAAYILHVDGDFLWKAGCQKHGKPKFDKQEFDEKIEKAVKKQEKKAKKDKKKKKKDDGSDDEGSNDDEKMLDMFGAVAQKREVDFDVPVSKKSTAKIPAESKKDSKKETKKDAKPSKAKAGAGKNQKEDKVEKTDDKKKNSKKKGKWDDEDEEEGIAIEDEPHEHNSDEDHDSEEVVGESKKKTRAAKKNEKKLAAPVVQVSKEDMKAMDEALEEAFLNACKTSVTAKDLPIETGKFWSNHMIPCKGADSVELDWKLSSFKKIGKFLQMMEKQELIEYHDVDKKNPTAKITKISWASDKISDWEPTIEKPRDLQRKGAEKDDDLESKNIVNQMQVEYVVKYKKSLWDILKVGEDTVSTPAEAEKKFLEFLRVAKLLEGKNIIINEDLVNAFGTGVYEYKIPDRSEETEEGGHKNKHRDENSIKFDKMPKSDLFDIYNKMLIDCHRVLDAKTKQTTVKQSKFKGIELIAEKAKNRFVTRVIGLENFGLDPENFVDIFKTKYATSVNTQKIESGKKGPAIPHKEVVIQGTFIEDVKEFLVTESKIPEEFIEENNKVAKKKKEKGAVFM